MKTGSILFKELKTLFYSLFKYFSRNVHIDDDDTIDIEQQNSNSNFEQDDNQVIILSDSDADDDHGIDVTDNIPPSVSSINNTSITSSDSGDLDIAEGEADEELELIDEIEQEYNQQHEPPIDDESTSLEITINDDSCNSNNQPIYLTDDELSSISRSPYPFRQKPSINVP